MDPLSALSLAASIVQFIDFGVKLVSSTIEIANTGSTVSVQHLSHVTSDLTKINSSLKQQFKNNTEDAKPLTKEEVSLQDLAEKCNKVAQELLDCLEKITTKEKGTATTWKNVRTALKTVWSRGRVETLAGQLSEYREQLSLRLLLFLNSQRGRQDEKLDLLCQTGQDIVEVVSINFDSLHLKLDNQRRQLRASQHGDQEKAEERHAEVIAAILTTRNGTSRTIQGKPYSQDITKLSKDQIPQSATTYREIDSEENDGIISNIDIERDISTTIASITERILNALHFREIADRRSAVSNAHEKTFQWLFQEPIHDHQKWDNFLQWLRAGKGCYWVNGKAGSGKSTLMKYLQDDSRMSTALRIWAGDDRLIIGSFFFWYAGTPLQKSQNGLLRSLLFDVLSKKRELVPVLFPNVCRSIISGQLRGPIKLSFIELEKAFISLVNSVQDGLKVCFIIDGVDEYEGDHDDLANLFAQATASNSVKILLSSRPIPSCVYAFSGCCNLKLQDLTHLDIRQYAKDSLGRHPLMARVNMAKTGATAELIDVITAKASGVFLWVVLVVKLLLRGLKEYDTMSDLQRKLDELPPDLEKLYDHMLGSMSPLNRRQGSILLQFLLRSTEIHGQYPVTLLQLSFAEEEDYIKAIKSRTSGLSSEDEAWRCESTEGRLRSRCCGLIEVQEPLLHSQVAKSGYYVGFFHRTVVEFLKDNIVWERLASLTLGTKFHVDQALLSSSLSEMKAKPPRPHDDSRESQAFRSFLRMLTYDLSLDQSMRFQFWTIHLSEAIKTLGWENWNEKVRSQLKLNNTESFLLSAGTHCSDSQLHAIFDLYDDSLPRDLVAALLLSQYVSETRMQVREIIFKNILACGIHPDTSIEVPPTAKKNWNNRWKHAHETQNWSLWQYVLHYAYDMLQYPDRVFAKVVRTGILESFLDLAMTMLKAGGDPNATIVTSWVTSQEFSAFAVLDKLTFRTWDTQVASNESLPMAPRTAADSTLSKKTLAEKLARIETFMNSKSARKYIGDWPRPAPDISASRKGGKLKRVAGNIMRSSPSPPEPQTQSISPWAQYASRIPVAQSPATPESIRSTQERQRENRWSSTSRVDRVKLLDPEAQELAIELARVDLDARSQRLALNRMSCLPMEKKSKILECSKALKTARKSLPAEGA